MIRVHQTFGDQTTSQRDVVGSRLRVARCIDVRRSGDRQILVNRPRRGAMVKENVVCPARSQRIIDAAGIAQTRGDVLDDDVISFNRQPTAYDRDPWIGRSLSGDGEMGISYTQRIAVEVDDTADFENHDSRSAVVERLTERTRPARLPRCSC